VAYENGVDWQPIEPEKRGRHETTASALEAAFRELTTIKSPFFDSVVDRWHELFPTLAARPGRYEDGYFFLYVKSAPVLFMLRPRLKSIRTKLASLPNAPKRFEIRLEIKDECDTGCSC